MDVVYVSQCCEDASDFCLVTRQYRTVVVNNEAFAKMHSLGNWAETAWRLLQPRGYLIVVASKQFVSEREIRICMRPWFPKFELREEKDIYEVFAQKKDSVTMEYNWALQKGVFNLPLSSRHNQYSNFGPYSTTLENLFLEKLDRQGYAAVAVCNATLGISVLTEAHKHLHMVEEWFVQRDSFWSQIENSLSRATVVPMRTDGKCGPKKQHYTGGLWVTPCFAMMDKSTQAEYLGLAPVVLFDHAYCVDPSLCEIGDGAVFSFHETKPLGCGEGGMIVVPERWGNLVRQLVNFGPPRRSGTNAKMAECVAFNLHLWWHRWDSIVRREFMLKVSELRDMVEKSVAWWMYEFDDAIPAALALRVPAFDLKQVQDTTKIPLRRYYQPLDDGKCPNTSLVMPIKPEIPISEYKKVLIEIGACSS